MIIKKDSALAGSFFMLIFFTMILFSGNEHAKKLDQLIISRVGDLNKPIKLVIVMVGKNPASQKYVRIKQKLCEKLGIFCELSLFDSSESDNKIFDTVSELTSDPAVDGIIVQLPLPRESLNPVLDLIDIEKDVDCLNSKNTKAMSPVVRSLEYFLKEFGINPNNMKTAVIGSGQLVGKPVTSFLSERGAEVTVLDEEKPYIVGSKLETDLLILCAGKPGLIHCKNVVSGCNVVDFGTSVIAEKVVGDLEIHSACTHLGVVSPSPGGMGPLVTRFLLLNLLQN